MYVAFIGAGSCGTAFAKALAGGSHNICLWDRNAERLKDIEEKRENLKHLPGVKLPQDIECIPDMKECLKNADMVVFCVPAQAFRVNYQLALPFMHDDAIVVNAAKGIETASLCRLSEIALSIKPSVRYAVLSGPSHAEEVGRGKPASLVAASYDERVARMVQDVFMSETFRIYTSDDVMGVELGGALKNIIALGAGIADGLEYGDNAKAALMTRGLVEMVRLGEKLGANPATFYGLSGVGDLVATCCSVHSRNRRCGVLIGKGVRAKDAVERMGAVVEGVYTCEAAYDLAKKLDIEMPITEAIHAVIHGKTDPKSAVHMLMTRSKKSENPTESEGGDE